MAFKQSCFIRKDTEKLRKELSKLGYTFSIYAKEKQCIATATTALSTRPTAAIIHEESFDSSDPHITWNCAGRIDCGTNEEMFLALAALRDDYDIHQWMIVTDLKGINWIKCVENKFTGDVAHSVWKKASVDDIIEHFKTK